MPTESQQGNEAASKPARGVIKPSFRVAVAAISAILSGIARAVADKFMETIE
jgi:hypothetical protein